MDYKIEQLRYQLREDPSSRVFYSLAEALRRHGEAGEAAAVLRSGLEVHPRYAAAWVSLGRCLRDVDDVEGAGEAFGRALELDRSNMIAARAVGELAMDRGDWAAATAAFQVVRDGAPDDAAISEKIAEAEAALARESAEREALAAAPPAEVVRLSDEDPFADAVADDDSAAASDDVFGVAVADEPLTEGDVPEATFEVPAAAQPEPFGELPEETDESVFDVAIAAVDDVEVEAESWADVTDEDTDTVGWALRVEPPADSQPTGLTFDADPVEGSVRAEPETEVPDIVEPIIEEQPGVPAEPEPESWADLDEDGSSDEGPQSAPPIIPETLAAFDGPSDEPEDEVETVQPSDVPVPTLTLARLALQQGDERLAKATLTRLLERDPSHAEAAELLESLQSRPRASGGDGTSTKVAALRGWLDTIRLASERH